MLSFPTTVRIWLASQPVDLRKGFDTLAEQVRQHLHHDPLSGHLFVFRNKRSDRVKLLYWDEDGYVIVYKRLEAGTFPWPAVAAHQTSVPMMNVARMTPTVASVPTAHLTDFRSSSRICSAPANRR